MNNRTSIFGEIGRKAWDSEIIDKNNFNNDFEEFQMDFLEICLKEFDDIILIRGEVIK